MRDGHDVHTTSRIRRVVTGLTTVAALALTAFAVVAGVDMATTTYVGWEVGFARAVVIAATLSAVLSWTGVVVLRRTARRER